MIKGFIKIFIIIFSFFSFLNGKSQETEPVYPIEEETFEEIEYNEEDFDPAIKILELQEKIDGFLEELNGLQNSYTRPFKITKDQRLSKTYMKRLSDDIKSNERKLKSFDLRWNIFYQTEQPVIATDDELMTMVDDLNIIKSAVEDSIAGRRNIVQAINDFNAAEKFLADQDTIYKVLGKKAMELSLTSKTAPQLENLKVKEQIIFEDIQSHYEKAKQGSSLFKLSQQEIDNLDNRYAALKNKSVKIQEMAYVPWIQRIKDYLLGIAAVAIIIMFFNMVVSKIKAAKKMKDNLKKYQETMDRNENNDIPSI
ncbi:MAG: hypothetical protein J1E82_04665 [Muribaculaceae bacterium]|nr:hypothetical protein [Muribaculaceae bacterium]